MICGTIISLIKKYNNIIQVLIDSLMNFVLVAMLPVSIEIWILAFFVLYRVQDETLPVQYELFSYQLSLSVQLFSLSDIKDPLIDLVYPKARAPDSFKESRRLFACSCKF